MMKVKKVSVLEDGSVCVQLLSDKFGVIAFVLPEGEARALAQFITLCLDEKAMADKTKS